MAQAKSISLSKFTDSVQAAVSAAQARNPKFAIGPVEGITISSLIRGFPVPWEVAEALTVGELQGIADSVAAHVAGDHVELREAMVGGTTHGTVYTVGRHIICGIPPVTEAFLLAE